MTEHEDDDKGRVEVQALTTTTCYGNSWTLSIVDGLSIECIEESLSNSINSCVPYPYVVLLPRQKE